MAAAIAVVVALAACGEKESTGPVQLRQDEGGTAGGDSTSSPTPLPASVDLSGQVLVVERFWPPAANGDTLQRTPLGGAGVALLRRVVVDGAVSQQPVGKTTTDAQGQWGFDDIAGGYYTLEVTPPAGSGLAPASYHVSATVETVVFMAHLWKP